MLLLYVCSTCKCRRFVSLPTAVGAGVGSNVPRTPLRVAAGVTISVTFLPCVCVHRWVVAHMFTPDQYGALVHLKQGHK